MSSIVGFTISSGLASEPYKNAINAQAKALHEFQWLETRTYRLGETTVHVWGHAPIDQCIFVQADGSQLILIGSPTPAIAWQVIEKSLQKALSPSEFNFPWDGRAILLKISADGKRWNIWNDWVGSIPMIYAQLGEGIIVSTLEPVVVAAADTSPNDFFLPGLVCLLIHGHLMSDWTLYRQIKTFPADCVVDWVKGSLRIEQLFSVLPSQDSWELSWDTLVDRMYELSRNAIADVLKTEPVWLIPLSGGLDSRLIAGVAAQNQIDVNTYSWGVYRSLDSIYAEKIARKLDLPWKLVPFSGDYLAEYAPIWVKLFGSMMNFHGLHLPSFLDQIKSEPPGKIMLGFMGETLVGYEVRFQNELHSPLRRVYQQHPDGYVFISVKEIQELFTIPIGEALEEIADEIDRQRNLVSGSWFQRLRFLTFWGRQRCFTSFQSTLCDYWRGVATPYINRAYARFCLSLPRAVLDERRLQMDMFRRYFPELAAIPISFTTNPILFTEEYACKKKLAFKLPMPFRLGPLKEFAVFDNSQRWYQDCLRSYGKDSLWPIWESYNQLGDWIDLGKVNSAFEKALHGDTKAMNLLRSVQVLAYRLLESC